MRILAITFRLRDGEQTTLETRVSRRGKTFVSEVRSRKVISKILIGPTQPTKCEQVLILVKGTEPT